MPRPRGRPRREIDLEAVADAVAELFAEGGIESVTVSDTAEKLSVSRATLYRTVPNKQHLIGILLERCMRELTAEAQAITERDAHPRDRLHDMVRLQVQEGVRMRHYMPVFFGGGDLPADVFGRWRSWSREFESLWVDTVRDAMDAGVLERDDPLITTRLILGMCIWVCRWYRPGDRYDSRTIAEAAIRLLHSGPRAEGAPAGPPVPASSRAASAEAAGSTT